MKNLPQPHQSLRRLGDAAAGLRLDDLPAEAVMRAKQRIMDTVGCLVAGYAAGIGDVIRAYVLAQGGAHEATLLPAGTKTSVALASLAHGTYIHGLELSDAAPRGTVHPGNEVVPLALALAERLGSSGAAILPAVVAGYEVEIRIGRALFPSAFYRGWWTPGLLGVVGPAVTAAHLMGLDGGGIANAIGIALNLAPASVEHVNVEGASVKWLIGGHSTAVGLLAAEMAARGVTGLNDIAHGWLPVISEKNHPERLMEGIDAQGRFTQWEMLSGIVTKYFATVGPFAGPLDALFQLIADNAIQPRSVEVLKVECMKRAAMFDARHPANDITARSSLSYCLAAALYFGDPTALLGKAFTAESLANAEIKALEDRVHVIENEDYERRYPAQSLARITLHMRDGSVRTLEVDRAARPRYLTPTDADIEGKFRSIATQALGAQRTELAIDALRGFEHLRNIDSIIATLAVGAAHVAVQAPNNPHPALRDNS